VTPEALVRALESRGVRLAERGDGDLVVKPWSVLPEADREALRQSKVAVLALLRARIVDPLADMDDHALYRHTGVREFLAPFWGEGVFYLISGPQAALRLEAEGKSPSRVYCVCLVLDWRLQGLTLEAQAEAARSRLAEDGRVPCISEHRA
jgi:hypothetical protein